MADRYWVDDSGTASDTDHWSTTSGGSGGASVPGTGDKAIIDSNSGAGVGTITLDTNVTVGELFVEDPFNNTGVRFAGNGGFLVRGNATLESVLMIGGAPQTQRVRFDTQAGQNSILTMVGGSAYGEGQFTLDIDGTLTLASDLALTSTTSVFVLQGGAFNLNDNNFHCRRLTVQSGGTMLFGGGDVRINQSGGTALFISVNSSADITGGSGTIRFTGNAGQMDFGGKTYNAVEFNHPSGIGSINTTAGNVFDHVLIGGTNMKFLNSGTGSPIVTTRLFEAQGNEGTPIYLSAVTSTAAICAEEFLISYTVVGSINSACPVPWNDPAIVPTGTDSGGNTNWIFSHWFLGIAGGQSGTPRFDTLRPDKSNTTTVLLDNKPTIDILGSDKPAL